MITLGISFDNKSQLIKVRYEIEIIVRHIVVINRLVTNHYKVVVTNSWQVLTQFKLKRVTEIIASCRHSSETIGFKVLY